MNGTRVRVDAAFELNGETVLMEVKNGPYANLTPNQAIVYPQMEVLLSLVPVFFDITNTLAYGLLTSVIWLSWIL